MLRNPTEFFQKESEASLLLLDKGYLKENHVSLKGKADVWVKHLGVDPPSGYPEPVELKPLNRKRIQRYRAVLFKDADRMFRDEANKERFVHICDLMWTKLADYQQTLGYVAGFLSLTHDVPIVVKALTSLAFNPKYMPGYFKAEATVLNIDAWVWFNVVENWMPDIHKHLMKIGVQPTMYCQKYFGGLCIHVLPFKHLVLFFDEFFAHGFRYSFQFALSLLKTLSQVILQLNSHSEIMAVLRLDSSMAPPILSKFGLALDDSLFSQILAGAGAFEFTVRSMNIQKVREDCWKSKLERTMLSATSMDLSLILVDEDDEIVFSSETEESDALEETGTKTNE